jgi:hypothetical protein
MLCACAAPFTASASSIAVAAANERQNEFIAKSFAITVAAQRAA